MHDGNDSIAARRFSRLGAISALPFAAGWNWALTGRGATTREVSG